MNEFDILYKGIKLKVVCNDTIKELLEKHFEGQTNGNLDNSDFDYCIIICNENTIPHGRKYRLIDKWFDNAYSDVYIDNDNKICYATNFIASNDNNYELLIKYLVSNVFNRLLECYGFIGIHSSCVEKDDKGILFVAERYSGKTVCMLNLINSGYNFISNDRTAIRICSNHLLGYGLSEDVSIRLSKQFCSQQENQLYVDIANKQGILLNENEMMNCKTLHIRNVDLARINNVEKRLDTPISCIIRPFYDPYIDYPIFERIGQVELMDLLYSQYLPLVHETTYFLRNIKIGNNKDVDERIAETVNNLSKLPAYYCFQNEKTTKEYVKTMNRIVKTLK